MSDDLVTQSPTATARCALDLSLQDLVEEASELFKLLDTTSDTIRALEARLKELKANFPFTFKVYEEEKSVPKNPEERHLQTALEVAAYETVVRWSLSWSLDDITQKYRLLLIAEETEYLWHRNDPDDFMSHGRIEFKTHCVSKKPFIETDLQTRLKYACELPRFISHFKNYLKDYRTGIESIADTCRYF